ncbi:hypothetical protein KIN20_007861 [Parelaphostrongylus tenuis]|uniref:PH domain-containing protein n=1 Tax=Parelaphostrongylus tenuis TaxID=148309 RepID=A0AAD5MPN4_PARTN|nr:hypothetical protein KIN20_007861 [Parelaphostrongylus tenuis]
MSSSTYPVPKPRTRFNIGAVCEGPPSQLNELELSKVNSCGSINDISIPVPKERLQNNRVEHAELLPPPYPPPPRPSPSKSESKLSAESTSPLSIRQPTYESENHPTSSLGSYQSPPVPSRANKWQLTIPHYIDKNSDDSVKSKRSQALLDTEVCGTSREGSESSNDAEENEEMKQSSSDFSCFSESPCGVLDRTIPCTTKVSSLRPDNFEERYTPTPQRCRNRVVEIAEDPKVPDESGNEHDENSAGTQFSSTTVAYFGDVSFHIGKKDRRKAHARLRNMRLSFHENDTAEECIAGPFSLLGCELICRNEQTITITLSEKGCGRSVTFTSDTDAETWTLLLGEVGLPSFEFF